MRKHHTVRLARVARQLAILVEQLVEQAPEDQAAADLPPMEAAILEALEDGRPQPGKRIAKATGYSYGGRLRHCLSDLTRRGVLHHSADGYRLMSRNVPAPQAGPEPGRANAEECPHERKRSS